VRHPVPQNRSRENTREHFSLKTGESVISKGENLDFYEISPDQNDTKIQTDPAGDFSDWEIYPGGVDSKPLWKSRLPSIRHSGYRIEWLCWFNEFTGTVTRQVGSIWRQAVKFA